MSDYHMSGAGPSCSALELRNTLELLRTLLYQLARLLTIYHFQANAKQLIGGRIIETVNSVVGYSRRRMDKTSR